MASLISGLATGNTEQLSCISLFFPSEQVITNNLMGEKKKKKTYNAFPAKVVEKEFILLRCQ